jgi:type I restriction enzyme R subunit
MSDLSDRRFAVVIDEAHSSQSGSAHDSMNSAFGDRELDAQDAIVEAMKSRKMKGNASYLAFTATPKPITLEKFGQKQEDGTQLSHLNP